MITHTQKNTLLLLLLMFSLNNTVHAKSFLHTIVELGSKIAARSTMVIKKNKVLSASILIGTIASLFAMQKIKHVMASKCAFHGRTWQYRFWRMLGGKIKPYSVETRIAFFNNIRSNNLDIVTSLLDDGLPVDIRLKDSNAGTALHLAVIKGNIALARLLLDHGASRDGKDGQGDTPLAIAQKLKRQNMIDLLSPGSTPQSLRSRVTV